MSVSRRQFSKSLGAVAAAVGLCPRIFGAAGSGLTLGLNTWSLRALSQGEAIPIIIQVMKQTGLQECQLLFSHVEPERFNPVFPVGLLSGPRIPPSEEQQKQAKAQAAALTEWRLSVPMTYFEDIRSAFEHQGLRIKSYAARLGGSAEEIDRLFLMAKALGADSINGRLPEPLTNVVAASADKHKMMVGLQVSNVETAKTQLAASKYFRLDPDTGDLTKGKIDALEFVQDNYKSISSVDLKDALPGGQSVSFGQGKAPIQQVLRFLQEQNVPVIAYIDCDHAGTGRSTEEVEKCVAYARDAIVHT